MGIVRLRIKNFRGIDLLDEKVGEKGAIVKGRNASGKTSVLNSLRAALAARDIHEDAIRSDEERAEVLVDFDHFTVKRVIERDGPAKLRITNPDGDVKERPQSFLNDLFGSGALDPLELFLAKPKDRRKLILEALPVKLTDEHINRWIPEWAQLEFITPELRKILLEVHGLDAVREIYKKAYEIRADANAKVKAAQNDIVHEEKKADEIKLTVPEDAPTIPEATANAQAARAQLAELESSQRRYLEQAEKRDLVTEKAKALRAEAIDVRASMPKVVPSDVDIAALDIEITDADNRLRKLEAELKIAREVLAEKSERRRIAGNLRNDARLATQHAEALEAQAKALDETIKSITEEPVSAEAIEHARANLDHAEAAMGSAQRRASLEEKRTVITGLVATKETLEKRALDLTEIVDTLAKNATRELIKESDGIEGLDVNGDDLTLDGVSIDKKSGAEQMRFAVEVARRANPKAMIHIVDGLERLDPEQLDVFVREATRDGWQLIGSRVAAGARVWEAITLDEKDQAAE